MTPTEYARQQRIITRAAFIEHSLARRFPALSDDDVHDAVMDALCDASAFTEAQLDEDAWRRIYYWSFRNASNAAAKRAARLAREARWWHTYVIRSETLPDPQRQDALLRICGEIERHLPDFRMQVTFRHACHGESSISNLAEALGLSTMVTQPEIEVIRREKDRLRKFLRRSVTIRTIAAEAFD